MVEKFTAKINQIVKLNSVTKIFKFNFNGVEEFNFIPGQFVMGSVNSFVNKKGIPIKRSYSIASKPCNKFLELCIECKHPGGFSDAIFKANEGDEVFLEGPFGKFNLDKDLNKNSIFLAAGVGIAPFISMFEYMFENNVTGKILFLFSFREKDDFLYEEQLRQYDTHNRFQLVPFLTSKEDVQWDGERGRIDIERLKKYADSNSECYICGGNNFNKGMTDLLLEFGIPKNKIHKESFW